MKLKRKKIQKKRNKMHEYMSYFGLCIRGY